MAKYVNPSHITSESGVIKFKAYCNQHNPFIIFREIKEHDYGIDGEIELIKFYNGKTIASGHILKVQLKSTASSNSYIKNQTTEGFTFYASNDDYEYWANHNLGVILVIYDAVSDRLFARKITKEEFAYHKKHSKSNSYPIQFIHSETELFLGEGSFFDKVHEDYFKPRVDVQIEEKLISNIQFFSSYPKKLFVYDTILKDKKEVFAKLDSGMFIPPFVIYNKKIYSFVNIALSHKTFRDEIIENGTRSAPSIKYDQIYEDKPLLNHYVELLNIYLKDFFIRERKLWLDRKNRNNYFFPRPNDLDTVKINYKTRKRGALGERTVVNYYEYGKDSFFRHLGFVYYIDFLNAQPVFILNYKYHFTINGTISLSPLKITSFTNKLNSREFNPTVINHQYFWFEYLSGGSYWIDIENSEELKIKIKAPEELRTSFGIYRANNFIVPSASIVSNEAIDSQTKLF
jgi:hypothetical protein